jgi:hypothetical protein
VEAATLRGFPMTISVEENALLQLLKDLFPTSSISFARDTKVLTRRVQMMKL